MYYVCVYTHTHTYIHPPVSIPTVPLQPKHAFREVQPEPTRPTADTSPNTPSVYSALLSTPARNPNAH